MSALQVPTGLFHTQSGISTLHFRRPQQLRFTRTRTPSLIIQSKKLDSEKKPSAPAIPSTPQQKPQLPATNDTSSSKSKYPTPSDDYFDPGMVPDFWEGPQWNWLGFIIRYLWAIGIFVAIITCAILFVTYKPKPRDYRPLPQAPSLEDVEKILEDRRSPGGINESEEAPSIDSSSAAAPQEEVEEGASVSQQELQEEAEPSPLEAPGTQVFESKGE